jgi:GT2 family glycosyltransferase
VRVSVVIAAWNGIKDLEKCLEALRTQGYSDLEIIVVDNGSNDGSADFVAARNPDVRLIRNPVNLGFAAASNQGLRAATGDVLVLLNQDTVVQAGCIAALVQAMAGSPSRGMAGAKAIYPDGRIQHAGGWVDERGGGSHYGYRQKDEGQFEQLRDVDFVTGAMLAVSRATYDAIGGLDESFGPAYYEDVDWCYRAREAGFGVIYVPQAVLIHREASTAADMSYSATYALQRNRLFFLLKHWPLQRLSQSFVPAERTWLLGLSEGSELLIAAVHHAYLYHLLHLDGIVAWRARAFETIPGEMEALAQVLLTLRATVSLRPAWPGPPAEAADLQAHTSLDSEIQGLRALLGIRDATQPVPTNAPPAGGTFAALRRLWHRLTRATHLLAGLPRQAEFNVRALHILERMSQERTYERQRLDAVLSEYLSENGRELGELAQELRHLRASLDKLQPPG